MRIQNANDLAELRKKSLSRIMPDKAMLIVGMGTCGIGNGASELYKTLDAKIKEGKLKLILKKAGCFGFCAVEPILIMYLPGKPMLLLSEVQAKDAGKLLKDLSTEEGLEKVALKALCKISAWDFQTSSLKFGEGYEKTPEWNEISFFKGQQKIVLRDAGIIAPEEIDDYIAIGGYAGLAKVLGGMKPEDVIAEVKTAKLRGRGGAGFPAARKWELMRMSKAEPKYAICNADEGDPGAYMNRNEIESDPHMLLEGMLIGAFAMGASKGILYVRAEYPLAVERLKIAIGQARELGLVGENILGSKFSFDIELVEGAGAFVCGEETALIASAEGKAGRPVPRPPFPAQKGVYGLPTNINNVETWCNVAAIIAKGGAWFASTGTKDSPGTKVFSLVGKVKNTGLVELPFGTTLESIIYGMGEGTGNRKRIRAVQTGGPSGGCIPTQYFNTPVDYESLNAIGAIMGSGGMVVMDQDNCMVDTARYFVGFTASESCGKCSPCREGLSQCKRILDGISEGRGTEADLILLESLARVIKDSALCQLGQTSANPILTTLKYFREEYEAHIREKRCKAGVCEKLYLALCENSCPLHINIPGYLQLLKEGRLEEAFELTIRGNPLPGTVGRICHFHCQMRCRRDTIDEPVHQGEIHRYLADTMYKMGKEKELYAKLVAEKLPDTGKKISIVGAGPAGLTAAYYLTRLGHDVTLYDSHAKPGGILRYGIPAYRLPKDIVDKEISLIKKLGAKFEMNTAIGKELSFEKLEKESDIVMLAFGAQEDVPMGVPGESLEGVLQGYHFLEEFADKKAPKIGKKVVIVGAGNVAIDSARTALRLGAHVTIVYRREKSEMPANAEEILGAQEEGIEFKFLCAPNAILDDGKGHVNGIKLMKMVSGGVDESGRRKPIPSGKTEVIACDTILSAVGERVPPALVSAAKVDARKNGTIKVDRFSYATSKEKFFAIGDAVSGPATVAEAMGMAKIAAEAVDAALMGPGRFAALSREFLYADEVPESPEETKMVKPPKLPVPERIRNFIEINSGFTGEQARMEAERCLRCDVKESCDKNAKSAKKSAKRQEA